MLKVTNNFISRFDSFSENVTFTINGKEKFKTKCGGVATLLIAVLMLAYLAILVSQPLEYSTTYMSTNNSGNDTSSDCEVNDCSTDYPLIEPSKEYQYIGNAGYAENIKNVYIGTYDAKLTYNRYNLSADNDFEYFASDFMIAVRTSDFAYDNNKLVFYFLRVVKEGNETVESNYYNAVLCDVDFFDTGA